MPVFRGKEIDEIRSWIFEGGEDLFVCHNDELEEYFITADTTTDDAPDIYTDTTPVESEHAIRVLGCISGAFKTQGESNT